jgi:hypothetical protein
LGQGDPLTSWQQLARGLHHHWKDGHLERIILLTSGNRSTQHGQAKDGGGSDKDAEIAVAIFTDLLNVDGRRVVVEIGPARAVDFEVLEDVLAALRAALKHAQTLSYKDHEIVVDVTGGLKTTSIAGALVTLDRRDLIFQYVPSGATGVVIPKAYQVVARASNLPV